MQEGELLEQQLLDAYCAEHGGSLGRFHRYEDQDAHIIVSHEGQDIRFTFRADQLTKQDIGGVEVLLVAEDAIPRDVVMVGPPYHPKVILPKALVDAYAPKAFASAARLAKP